MNNISKHQAVCNANQGRAYGDVRNDLIQMDWDGYYPEVDLSGCLTGRVINAESPAHLVCDIKNGVVVFGEHTSDAMIEMTPEQAICEAVMGAAEIDLNINE